MHLREQERRFTTSALNMCEIHTRNSVYTQKNYANTLLCSVAATVFKYCLYLPKCFIVIKITVKCIVFKQLSMCNVTIQMT